MGEREDGCVEARRWISEATWCQQPSIFHCVPVKALVWQQACDLAPSTTPCWEARPGVTDPLTGSSPSFNSHPFFTSPFYFRLYTTPRRSHLQPFLQQQPFCALLCLYPSSFYRKPDFTVMSHVFLLPRLVFGGLTGTSCSHIMPVIFFIINFKIFSKLL